MAKNVNNWESELEELKKEKVKAKFEENNKPVPADYMRTFTNLVVKKEDPSAKRISNTQVSSRKLLAPMASRSNLLNQDLEAIKSTIKMRPSISKPNLAVAKDTVFLTGINNSQAQNESSRRGMTSRVPAHRFVCLSELPARRKIPASPGYGDWRDKRDAQERQH